MGINSLRYFVNVKYSHTRVSNPNISGIHHSLPIEVESLEGQADILNQVHVLCKLNRGTGNNINLTQFS